jgi:CheY-like chemotaxis protein
MRSRNTPRTMRNIAASTPGAICTRSPVASTSSTRAFGLQPLPSASTKANPTATICSRRLLFCSSCLENAAYRCLKRSKSAVSTCCRRAIATKPGGCLKTQLQVQVVLTDRVLPDGDWRAVLEIVAQGRAYVQVVVCSRLRDHTLLIDVLEQGAHDVLVELYQREEVRRVLEAAAARSCVLPRSLARMTSYENKAARTASAA